MNNKHTIEKHLLFLYNEITESEKEDVLRHWEKCGSCKKDYEQLREIKEKYISVKPDEPSDRLVADLIKSFNSPQEIPYRSTLIDRIIKGFQPKYRLAATFGLLIFIITYFIIPVKDHKIKTIDHSQIVSNIKKLYSVDDKNKTLNSGQGTVKTIEHKQGKLIAKNKKQMKNDGYGDYIIFSGFAENSLDEKLRNIDSRINKLISELKNDFVINIVEE